MPTAIPTLVATIKRHLAKVTQSEKTRQQNEIAAGMRLKELKARKPASTTWPAYVRKTFNLSRERADELIRIADGKATADEVRANTAERMRRNRSSNSKGSQENPVSRDTGSDDGPSPGFGQFKNAKGEIKSSCDFNPADPDDVAEPGDSDEVIRQRIFMNLASEATRLAQLLEEKFFDVASAGEVNLKLIDAARKASVTWTKVMTKLERLKGETAHEEETIRPALH